MKAEVVAANTRSGLRVDVVPETEAEQSLLDAIWKFGRLDTGYSSTNPRAKSYSVIAFRTASAEKGGDGE